MYRSPRFYDSQGWQNILSFGDQWTDHTSLLKTAKAFGLDAPIKTVKAQEGLTAEALGQQLRLVGRMLPSPGLKIRSASIIDTSYSYFGLVLACIDADFCK